MEFYYTSSTKDECKLERCETNAFTAKKCSVILGDDEDLAGQAREVDEEKIPRI